MIDVPQLMTVHEVAARLRFSPRQVYRLCETNQLPCVRLGRGKWRSVRIRPEAVQSYLEQEAVPVQPQLPRARVRLTRGLHALSRV